MQKHITFGQNAEQSNNDLNNIKNISSRLSSQVSSPRKHSDDLQHTEDDQIQNSPKIKNSNQIKKSIRFIYNTNINQLILQNKDLNSKQIYLLLKEYQTEDILQKFSVTMWCIESYLDKSTDIISLANSIAEIYQNEHKNEDDDNNNNGNKILHNNNGSITKIKNTKKVTKKKSIDEDINLKNNLINLLVKIKNSKAPIYIQDKNTITEFFNDCNMLSIYCKQILERNSNKLSFKKIPHADITLSYHFNEHRITTFIDKSAQYKELYLHHPGAKDACEANIKNLNLLSQINNQLNEISLNVKKIELFLQNDFAKQKHMEIFVKKLKKLKARITNYNINMVFKNSLKQSMYLVATIIIMILTFTLMPEWLFGITVIIAIIDAVFLISILSNLVIKIINNIKEARNQQEQNNPQDQVTKDEISRNKKKQNIHFMESLYETLSTTNKQSFDLQTLNYHAINQLESHHTKYKSTFNYVKLLKLFDKSCYNENGNDLQSNIFLQEFLKYNEAQKLYHNDDLNNASKIMSQYQKSFNLLLFKLLNTAKQNFNPDKLHKTMNKMILVNQKYDNKIKNLRQTQQHLKHENNWFCGNFDTNNKIINHNINQDNNKNEMEIENYKNIKQKPNLTDQSHHKNSHNENSFNKLQCNPSNEQINSLEDVEQDQIKNKIEMKIQDEDKNQNNDSQTQPKMLNLTQVFINSRPITPIENYQVSNEDNNIQQGSKLKMSIDENNKNQYMQNFQNNLRSIGVENLDIHNQTTI